MQTSDEHKASLLDGWNSPPNLVTYLRIILMFVFVGLDIAAGPLGLHNPPLRWAAAILFMLAAFTDKLDGWMARQYNQVTELGKLMDPIADKLLICSTLVVSSAFGELTWWITVPFLVREIGITAMRFFVIDTGGKVIAASKVGKYKTLAECLGLSVLLLPVWTLKAAAGKPMWLTLYMTITFTIIVIALILCLYSGAVYLHGTFWRRGAENNRPKPIDAGSSPSVDQARDSSNA